MLIASFVMHGSHTSCSVRTHLKSEVWKSRGSYSPGPAVMQATICLHTMEDVM